MSVTVPSTAARNRAAPTITVGAARVLLVDDSMVVRSVLERIIGTHAHFDICGSLGSAADAVTFLKTASVDVVILDVEMPDGSGLDALPDILYHGGDARVLVLSSSCEEGGPAALRALSLGACDTLAKPGRTSFSGSFAEVLLTRLAQLVQPDESGAPLPDIPDTPPAPPPDPRAEMNCVAIGASTGGIPALHTFLGELDRRVDAPIVITQHLPAVFIPYLVKQLAQTTGRMVRLAETGMKLENGHVYIAPGEGHLTVENGVNGAQIRIISDKLDLRYMPAVDPMFASVAEIFGKRALGIVLSGMGNDGCRGAEKMAGCGAAVYAQDADSCVVWGMPGAIARAGLATAILSPERIAAQVSALWKGAI